MSRITSRKVAFRSGYPSRIPVLDIEVMRKTAVLLCRLVNVCVNHSSRRARIRNRCTPWTRAKVTKTASASQAAIGSCEIAPLRAGF